MTLTNNYAHAIMKQKKAKTDYLHGLSVFVFIVNELGPFEKPFHKLDLCVSLGFPNTRKQKHEAKGSVLSSVFSCLETLMKHSPSFMNYYIFPIFQAFGNSSFTPLHQYAYSPYCSPYIPKRLTRRICLTIKNCISL